MKKITATVICLILVFSSMTTVLADEGGYTGIVSKTVQVSGNGDVEVLIDIAGNPGITSLSLDVSYDSNVLTLKEKGFEDTGLLKKNIQTTLTVNPFRLSWNHSDQTAVNNYENGTIAKLYFKMKEGFYGTTDINVKYVSAQSFINKVFVRPPVAIQGSVISVTRDKFALKNGVVIANGLNGESLIMASYNEDGMIDCKVYPDSKGDFEIKTEDVLNTNGATFVKAFLWENLETLVPKDYCEEEL